MFKMPWMGWGLFAFTILLYWPGTYGPFFLDDANNLRQILLDNWSWQNVWSHIHQNSSGPLGRPVSMFSFAFTAYAFGESALAFKWGNVLLHALTGWVFWALSHQLNRGLPEEQQFPRHWLLWGLGLWLCHPLLISTVLYPVQRMTILSTLFGSLSVWGYLQFRYEPKARWLGMSVGCALLAIFSKENALLLPLLIATIEWAVSPTHQSTRWKTVTLSGALLTLLVLGGYIVSSWPLWAVRYESLGFSPTERLLTQVPILWTYLQQWWVPQAGAFGLFLDDIRLVHSPDVLWTLQALGFMVAVLIALTYHRSARWLFIGVFWFLISHLLESTVIPLELAFEHRNYWGSMGLMWTTLWAIGQLHNHWRPLIRNTLIILWAVALLGLSAHRVWVWGDSTRFYETALSRHPLSARAHTEYANRQFESGDWGLGIEALHRARELSRWKMGFYWHELIAHCEGEAMPTRLIEAIDQHYQHEPMTPYLLNAMDHSSLGILHGQCPALPPELLIAVLAHHLDNPHNLAYRDWLPISYGLLARAYIASGELERAFATYDKAYETDTAFVLLLFEKADMAIQLNERVVAQATLAQIEGAIQGSWMRYPERLNNLRVLIAAMHEEN